MRIKSGFILYIDTESCWWGWRNVCKQNMQKLQSCKFSFWLEFRAFVWAKCINWEEDAVYFDMERSLEWVFQVWVAVERKLVYCGTLSF